jgi:hypothetical protein
MQWTPMGSSSTRLPVLLTLIVTTGLGLSMAGAQTSSQSATSKIRPIANDILRWKGAAKLRLWSDPKGSRGEGMVLLPGGHLLVAKEKAYRCSFDLLLRHHRWRREPRRQWVPIWSYGYSLRRIHTFALP